MHQLAEDGSTTRAANAKAALLIAVFLAGLFPFASVFVFYYRTKDIIRTLRS